MATPASFWKKYGPMIPPDQNPHQTVTFSGCIWSWCISHGLVSSQIRQFCLFTYPFIQKWGSSLKMIYLAKFGLTSNCSRTQSANTRHRLWSFTLSSWVSWILQGCRSKSRRKIRQIEVAERSSSCETRNWPPRVFPYTLTHSSDVFSRCVSAMYWCWLIIYRIGWFEFGHQTSNSRLGRTVVARIKIT